MNPAVSRAPLVYLITDRRAAGGRPLAGVVGQALGALSDARLPPGAVAVQLREKDLGGRELLILARELRAVTAAAGARLFVNDRVDVALAAGADGVHLGGGALAVEDVAVLAPNLEVGVSTHSRAEVEQAAGDPRVGFVVFGPVFAPLSKPTSGTVHGLDGLRAACAAAIPVLALGGVQADRIPACFKAGASGVASMGAVLGAPHSQTVLRAFFRAIERT